jgi:CheY-like chemotaxis protein
MGTTSRSPRTDATRSRRDAVRAAAALIDLTLPVLDGFDVARQLRADRDALLSPHCDDGVDGRRIRRPRPRRRIREHLVKPISVDALLHAPTIATTQPSESPWPREQRPSRAEKRTARIR